MGFEKNLPLFPGIELPVFKIVAFSNEAKPNDNGPVDLLNTTAFSELSTFLTFCSIALENFFTEMTPWRFKLPVHDGRRQVDVQVPRIHGGLAG